MTESSDFQLNPDQRPPNGYWSLWTMVAGRGAGKSRAAAEWLVSEAAAREPGHWAIIAPNFEATRYCAETVATVAERQGVLTRDPGPTVVLTSKATLHLFSAHRGTDALRGYAWHGAWLEDIEAWDSRDPWEVLRVGLRHYGQVVATVQDYEPDMVKALYGERTAIRSKVDYYRI